MGIKDLKFKRIGRFANIDTVAADLVTPADELIRKEEAANGPAITQILEAELALAVGDWACQNPQRWRTLRMRHTHPELTIDQLAARLGIGRATVIRHLKRRICA